MEIASIIGLACFIAACFLAALTGALFRPGEWYERLKKPSWWRDDCGCRVADLAEGRLRGRWLALGGL